MKKAFAHLPDNKRNELKRIVSVIHELCDDVEVIILFGSYAGGDYKEELEYLSEQMQLLLDFAEKIFKVKIESFSTITRNVLLNNNLILRRS